MSVATYSPRCWELAEKNITESPGTKAAFYKKIASQPEEEKYHILQNAEGKKALFDKLVSQKQAVSIILTYFHAHASAVA